MDGKYRSKMSTESFEPKKECTIVRVVKTIWPFFFFVIQIITVFGAALQVIFLSGFLVVVIVAAILVSFKIHNLTGFLDDFTGLGLGSRMSSEVDFRLFLIVLVVVLFVALSLCMCAKLYHGLTQGRSKWVYGYLLAGAVCLGIRVYLITSHEFYDSNDNTDLYCTLYFMYLVLVAVHCMEISQAQFAETQARAARIVGRTNTIPYSPV